MLIGVPAESRPGETRVAATPETVKKLTAKGLHQVLVQSGAGTGSSIPDAEFAAAGAKIVAGAAEVYVQAEILLKVRRPEAAELGQLRSGAVLIGLLDPFNAAGIEASKDEIESEWSMLYNDLELLLGPEDQASWSGEFEKLKRDWTKQAGCRAS